MSDDDRGEARLEDALHFLARISLVQGRNQFLRTKTFFRCWRNAWKKDVDLVDEVPVATRICSTEAEFDEIDIKTIKACEKLVKIKKALSTWSNEDSVRYAFQTIKNAPDCRSHDSLPSTVKIIFKKYDSSLWVLYCNYCDGKKLSAITNNNLTHEQKISKRILDNERLWSMLRDFNICPSICSKVMLNICIQELSSSSPFTSPLSSPSGSPTKFDSFGDSSLTNAKLMPTAAAKVYISFKGFQQLLYKISLECLELSTTTTVQSRIIFLLNRIDSSDGRKAMAKLAGAKVLPFFKIKM